MATNVIDYTPTGKAMADNDLTTDNGASAVNAGRSISSSEALMKLIKNIYQRDVTKFAAELKIGQRFNVDVASLRELRDEVTLNLSTIAPGEDIEFVGTVRFSNGKTLRYDEFDVLLRVSSNSEIPSSLLLKWSIFSIDKTIAPNAGEVSLDFVKKNRSLVNFMFDFFEDFNDTIEIKVIGSNEVWTKNCFESLIPYVKLMTVAGLFSLMHKRYARIVISVLMGVGILIVSYLALPNEQSLGSMFWPMDADYLQRVLSHRDAPSKIDELAKVIIEKDKVPVVSVFLFVISLFAFIFGGSFLRRTMIIMSPRSAIIMGASGKLVSRKIESRRFLLAVILIPIVISFVVGVVVALITT